MPHSLFRGQDSYCRRARGQQRVTKAKTMAKLGLIDLFVNVEFLYHSIILILLSRLVRFMGWSLSNLMTVYLPKGTGLQLMHKYWWWSIQTKFAWFMAHLCSLNFVFLKLICTVDVVIGPKCCCPVLREWTKPVMISSNHEKELGADYESICSWIIPWDNHIYLR